MKRFYILYSFLIISSFILSSISARGRNSPQFSAESAGTSGQYARDHQEDRFSTFSDDEDHEVDRVKICGVFDGHRGHRASDYAYKNMERCIRQNRHFNQYNLDRNSHPNKQICRALAEGIMELDEEILDPYRHEGGPIMSGSTGVFLVVDEKNKKLYAANVGDSRLVIGLKGSLKRETREDIDRAEAYANDGRDYAISNMVRGLSNSDAQRARAKQEKYRLTALQGNAFQPLRDHKPGDILEWNRIMRAGGHVQDVGGIHRVQGFLAVARNLGDRKYKLLSEVDEQWIKDNPDYPLPGVVSEYRNGQKIIRPKRGKDLPAANISFRDRQNYVFPKFAKDPKSYPYGKPITQNLTPCDPDIWTGRLNENYHFAILASDGVWDAIENEEAVEIVGRMLSAGCSIKAACGELETIAASRLRKPDNTSVVIVKFSDENDSSDRREAVPTHINQFAQDDMNFSDYGSDVEVIRDTEPNHPRSGWPALTHNTIATHAAALLIGYTAQELLRRGGRNFRVPFNLEEVGKALDDFLRS